jgi:hypothetical protein
MNPHDQRPLTSAEHLALKTAAWRECQRLDNAEAWARKHPDERFGAHDAQALAAYYLRRVQVKAMDRYWSGR